MRKNLKKLWFVFSMALVLAFVGGGCNKTESLDNRVAQTDSQTESEEERKSETAENSPEESEREEYFDVEAAAAESEDYSKYEEKISSSKVTYSDGKGSGQDEYLTDPVPEGQQNPTEPGEVTIDTSKKQTCYLSISCATILDNMENLTEGKEDLVPSDGVIYAQREVSFYEGESVFDVLLRETQNNRIHMEYSFTPMYNSNYIEGIYNLYEFDCGGDSGWMYAVNGWYPNYGCSRYVVQAGDIIEWNYTCDLGRDLGQNWMG